MNNSILNISILYVEDEPDARKNVSEIISRRITKFYTAENGVDALEIYKKHKPDLVLSDIQMPNMDGLQLTEKIKQINPNAKIILITAFTDTRYLLKSIELQVDGFIVKPIRKEKLIATIKKQSEVILLEKKSIEQEQALIKSEMKFKKMSDLLPLMIFETDIKGNITYANKKALSNYGYTEDELNTGINLISTVHSKDVSRAKQNISNVIRGIDIGDREYIVKRKDGSTFPILIYSQVIIDNNKPVGMRGVIIDMTDQKKAEEAVNKQNAELKIRNEELDAFSHTVAHDLKNPLGTIMGFAGLLYEGYKNLTDEEFEKYISIVIKSGDKTQQIINNLLLFASVRKEDAKIDELNMGFIVNEAINHYHDKIAKTNAKIKLPNHWPSVLGNASWIEEVWVNYLSNALKYGGTPPIIEFGFDNGKELNIKEGIIRFWIRDNGDGISQENQKLIFKKFERLNQTNIVGHGLGLSIVKRIIKKLGGKVGVENIKGEGSLFYFTLPTISKPETPNLKPETPNLKPQTNKLKILIAEDEFTSDNYLRILVKNISKETLHAKTGKEAIEIFQNTPDIDLILMDIKMPIMDGYTATKQIRKISKDVIIIAQTAYALSGDREKAIEAGCNDYITKPIDKDKLLEMINRLCL